MRINAIICSITLHTIHVITLLKIGLTFALVQAKASDLSNMSWIIPQFCGYLPLYRPY